VRVTARMGGRTGEVSGVKPGEQSVVVRLQSAGVLRGRVVRAGGGAPVQGFSVTLDAQGQGPNGGTRGPWEFAGQRFELGDVPAGQVRVRVRTEDGAGGEALVSTRPGEVAEVEVVMKAPAGVRGRVVDATTQEPLADARVFLEGPDLQDAGDRTGADGRFSFERLVPGEYSLEVTAGQARTPVRQPVKLVDGQVLDLGNVALSLLQIPPGSVGVLIDDDGSQVLIDSVIPGGPGAAAGLQEGDVLLTVDGAPVKSYGEASQRLRGAPGSPVVLTVRHAGAERSLTITRSR
jgi:hypothetical protein